MYPPSILLIPASGKEGEKGAASMSAWRTSKRPKIRHSEGSESVYDTTAEPKSTSVLVRCLEELFGLQAYGFARRHWNYLEGKLHFVSSACRVPFRCSEGRHEPDIIQTFRSPSIFTLAANTEYWPHFRGQVLATSTGSLWTTLTISKKTKKDERWRLHKSAPSAASSHSVRPLLVLRQAVPRLILVPKHPPEQLSWSPSQTSSTCCRQSLDFSSG